MQQRWNDGDRNGGKGVELYTNQKASLAPNSCINYQYTVDTTFFLHKPTTIYHDNHEKKCHLNYYHAV